MRICIYEDRRTADLEPLTLTRPASDLLCGMDSLAAKQSQHFAAEAVGFLGRSSIAAVLRERDPALPANDRAWLREAPTAMVNARWLPPTPSGLRITPGARRLFASGPSVGFCDGELAFAVLDSRRLLTLTPDTIDDALADLVQSLPGCEVGGRMIRRPWDLLQWNAKILAADFASREHGPGVGHHPTHFALTGRADRLFVHPTAKLDPYVVADTTKGPVWIGPECIVSAFTRLEGPCFIGAGTHLLGAKIRGGTTIGPNCRIGGEVECSTVQGFSNKYHDGFLGHSHLGEWVNLAAGTITGDLRFDYRNITMKSAGESIPTGEMKLGSIIGDHARTGLGVLLDCGTTVRPFAQILPTGTLAPRDVPAFTRVGPDGSRAIADVDGTLASAATAMGRRGKDLTPALAALYRGIAAPGAPKPLAEPKPLELRKSA
jgi:UDP-N-acetylglucosamine diphosphorylase/glucosamine-1-phosphate N-acetyltransferase